MTNRSDCLRCGIENGLWLEWHVLLMGFLLFCWIQKVCLRNGTCRLSQPLSTGERTIILFVIWYFNRNLCFEMCDGRQATEDSIRRLYLSGDLQFGSPTRVSCWSAFDEWIRTQLQNFNRISFWDWVVFPFDKPSFRMSTPRPRVLIHYLTLYASSHRAVNSKPPVNFPDRNTTWSATALR